MNKLFQFWQELKRRKVVRVITVYAAAAFVILELTDIVAPSLGLPDWTLNLIIILLVAGLIIATILSWIYDINPHGELVKTEKPQKVKEADLTTRTNGWKIATYISIPVIVGFIVLQIVTRSDKLEGIDVLEKSVAVLPFIDDSPDNNNEHIINGIMEDLLINLQTIKELRVPGRTTVEQYRNNPKPISEIAEEMGVAFIVEGSGQRYGNKIRLRVQLVEGTTDRHLWAASYDEEIQGPEDIFRIQSEISKAVAQELKAVITPVEKEILEKIPTTSLTAYDYYHRGREKLWNTDSYYSDKESLEAAGAYFNRALENDPLFAPAYAELAGIYYAKFNMSGHLEQQFLDSILIFSEKALSIDNQLASAYSHRGSYYYINLKFDRALQDFNRASELNPNDYRVYLNLGTVKSIDNLGDAIYYYQKASSLLSGSELAIVLSQLSELYGFAGFYEYGDSLAREAFSLHGDTAMYYNDLARIDFQNYDHASAIELLQKVISSGHSTAETSLKMGWHYMYLNELETSLKYVQEWMGNATQYSYFSQNIMHRVGYILEKNGFQEEADDYFKRQVDYCIKINELNQIRSYSGWTFYDLAAITAYKGDKAKAYEYLNKFILEGSSAWFGMPALFNTDPLFKSIRNEPEFKKIIRETEEKCQAEHVRVKKWLEENDML